MGFYQGRGWMPEKNWYIAAVSGILAPKSRKRGSWYEVGKGGALMLMDENVRIRWQWLWFLDKTEAIVKTLQSLPPGCRFLESMCSGLAPEKLQPGSLNNVFQEEDIASYEYGKHPVSRR